METARRMYERLGFVRRPDRDAPYEHEFNDRYLPRLIGAEARRYTVTDHRSLTS